MAERCEKSFLDTKLTKPIPFADVANMMLDIRRKLNGGAPYQEILDELFESLSPYLPYDRLGIAVIDANGQTVSLKWMRSRMRSQSIVPGYVGELKGSSLEKLLHSKSPRILNNLCEYLVANPHSKSTYAAIKDGILSSFTLPLHVDGKPIGFMFFSSGEINTYNESHSELFSYVVDEIALLVQYGRLRDFFEQNRNYEQFFRNALHDLKAPLAVIQGFIDLIREQPWFRSLDQDSEKFFQVLSRNAGFMFELIGDLNEMNRLKAPLEKTELREVLLSDFLEDIELDCRMLTRRKQITFGIESERLPATWVFDKGKIRQVLDNLISNAVKFSYPKTRLQITVKKQDRRLIFEVCDQGQGIPSDELVLLFKEFGKTSVCPTDGESSTGLGLAIVKTIVKAHGGEVSVRSEVGTGSVFIFWLPDLSN